MKSRRAFVWVPLVYWLAGGVLLTQAVPNWRISALFAKKPPTAELSKAEADLAAKTLAAQQAEAHYNAAVADFQAKKTAELTDSQQFLAGVKPALLRAPKSPEVTLAISLADRASKGLSQAIGDLPADRQAEILAIVDGALSAKQAEVDAANAKLATLDKELATTQAAKVAVEAQIPPLKAQADSAVAAKDAALNVVTAKANEVAAYADKAAAKEKEAGSLGALVSKLEWWGIVIAVGVLFVNFLLPSLAQEFPASKIISTVYRWSTSLTSSHKVSTS